jgi:phosphatidate cytidylyltransferase
LVYAAAALAVGWGVWALGTSGTSVATLALVDLAVWVIGLIWMLRYPIDIPRAYTLISGLIVLPIGWWLVTGLLSGRGPWWVLLLFGIVAAADIGAFFSGRAFGRVRLAPAVSPGKTWEGVIGGLLSSALVGAAAGYMLNWSLLSMALLAVAIGAISVIGDLTISMLKRTAGLKDSGRIFPGHGGVLDRVDSLLAALPVYLLGLGVVTGS